MKTNTFTMTDNRTGKQYEFDILDATRGPNVVDISTFYSKTGMFTYDNGFTSTANCISEITFIDGPKGELRYRGIEIEKLASDYSYLEVCYLLLNEALPTERELLEFDLELRHRSLLHESLRHLFAAFPAGAHPMATLSAATAALSTFYYDHLELSSEDDYQEMARRIIAKMPTVAAFAYRHSIGAPLIHPDIDRSFTENFLYMMRAYPGGKMHVGPDGEYAIKDIEVEALDTIFTLHADHEQNASTTTVRGVASTGAHPYVAISAGISALWGRAHGGANESVIAQLEMIGSVENVDKYIEKAKDPNDSFRLMGFGHRVYKNFDPRAKIIKKAADDVLAKLGINDPILEIAKGLEEVALSDPYFIERKLYPNVDFYSGIIYRAIGIPTSMFTVMFAIGRLPGWIAQWKEMRENGEPIGRPRQIYTGANLRPFVPMEKR